MRNAPSVLSQRSRPSFAPLMAPPAAEPVGCAVADEHVITRAKALAKSSTAHLPDVLVSEFAPLMIPLLFKKITLHRLNKKTMQERKSPSLLRSRARKTSVSSKGVLLRV